MNENRTVARWFGGILMVSAVVFGGVAPAEASDSGWNGTVAPASDVPVTTTTTDTTAATTTTTTDTTAATTTTTTDTTAVTPTAPLGGLVVTPSFRDSGWNG